MINRFILKIVVLLAFVSFFMEKASSQTNHRFSFDLLNSAKKHIGLLSYDGTVASKADTDIAKVPSFTYLSIGKIKHTIVIANGCVLVEISYKSGQTIVFEASSNFNQSSDSQVEIWNDNLLTNQDCQLKSQIKVNDARFSSTKVIDSGVRIHLINIKKKNVKLFKYMISSLEMEMNQ